ncbi:MAG TPA: imidazole glycerol phosphate synthase subunit HisH [Nitrosomonas nitrosa]|jgi:glutamine amidotransferase|uniref:Imidazole glycerol phosphate synthase subunit HisH n=1 Tax=Nitrosomonas nitrosa TaxID=52442 RepID=A0A1I4LDH6_9PROT|nr:imidazole glycerol phosphate synthase subunit HisH [Nitrosomonas nitrosa]MCO6434229.1 imidazole glycerol phosphate synthase subunit HisH [Nitrosomonas nitrosa]PTR04845.1 imidazole glycerol phosphate synthase subunit HisH [Nitrosomonas nitrosa]CAE6486474.1 imidazole glycerol phosphate synthase, glutamine amidotransferase subunit with HisF [Nitrosomonas nitrosa]SFL88991.1 imidazole glycerol phosphate synthase subunit hisH [Nitrosomonas nitrosa]HBZ30932.1 imidazole glycerol phosphate synthase 
MIDIAIVDYGMGNLRSVSKALEHVMPHASIVVTNDPIVVQKAARVVVPGQGAMPNCMHELTTRGLKQAVLEAAENKPFLGICIGLQMLFDESEEGNVNGLGILPGKVRHFPHDTMFDAEKNKLKVPHMGWNQVHQTIEHPLWEGIANDARFYFVHSYYVEAAHPEVTAAYTRYPTPFTCAVAKDNIFAVQFHPEKSHLAGLTLLSNFAKWEPESFA